MQKAHTSTTRWLTWLLAGLVAIGVTLPHQHEHPDREDAHAGCAHSAPAQDSSPESEAECALCAFLHAADSMVLAQVQWLDHPVFECGIAAPSTPLPSGRLVRLSVSARAPPRAAA